MSTVIELPPSRPRVESGDQDGFRVEHILVSMTVVIGTVTPDMPIPPDPSKILEEGYLKHPAILTAKAEMVGKHCRGEQHDPGCRCPYCTISRK